MQKKESPDFRFPEVGISGYVDTQLPLLCAFLPSVALNQHIDILYAFYAVLSVY